MPIVRSVYSNAVIDTLGNALPDATITVYQAGTTNPITETIYANGTDLTALANPFTVDAYGRFAFYLNEPKRVDLLVQATGRVDYTLANVDVARSSDAAFFLAAANASGQSKSLAWRVCSSSGAAVDIQAANDALTAAGGGTLELSEGVFLIEAKVLVDSKIRIQGKGMGITILRLKAGVNDDVIQSRNFLALTGTNSAAGEHHVVLADLSIDGVKASNATGWCLRKYGYHWTVENVAFKYGKSGGVWSEWGLSAGNPAGGDGMEDVWNNVRALYNDGATAIEWRGPHDTVWQNIIIFGNTGSALIIRNGATYGGGPLQATNLHVWGNAVAGPAIDLIGAGANLYGSNFQIEGSTGGVGIRATNGSLQISRFMGFLNAIDIQLLCNDHMVEGNFSGTIGVQIGSAGTAIGGVLLRGKFLGNTTSILWEHSNNQNNYIDAQAYISGGNAFMGGAGTFNPALNVLLSQIAGPGTGFKIEAKGAQGAVGDGGVIPHTLSGTPTGAIVTPSVANEFVSVTGRDGTNLTVAVKKHDGTPGTAQTLYWRAWL